MWLSNPVYEALPYILLLAGLLLGAAAYLSSVAWVQTAALIIGSIVAVTGLVLLLKRRDYRLSRSRIKYDRLD